MVGVGRIPASTPPSALRPLCQTGDTPKARSATLPAHKDVIATSKEGRPVIRSIQYLRVIAALMVVWHHGLNQVPGVSQLINAPEFGPRGVDLFFVISGFIMVMTTARKDVTPFEFFRHRIIRVVPLYWLVTLFMLGCAVIAPTAFKSLQYSPAAIVKSLLFIPYQSLSFPGEIWPVLVPGWTLNYEMFFYALFAASLLVPARYRLASLVATMVALVFAGLAHPTDPILATYTNPRLLEFAAGAGLGHYGIRGVLRVRLWVSVVWIGLGIWLLVMGWEPVAGAALIVAGCLNPGLAELKSRLLLALGDASYSIYLTHLFALAALRIVWIRAVPHESLVSAAAFMAVALAVSAAAGFAVYRWVEKPLTEQLRSMLRRPARPLVAQPVPLS
jgi:exopolysaccharide production protein ExoZ